MTRHELYFSPLSMTRGKKNLYMSSQSPVQVVRFTGLLLILVAGNFLGPLLSCKTRAYLQQNGYRHLLAFFMLLLFVVATDMVDTTTDTTVIPSLLGYGVLAYLCFLMFCKCEAYLLLPALFCMMLMVLLNVENNNKTVISDRLRLAEQVLAVATLLLVLVGSLLYVRRQRKEHGAHFSWYHFFLSDHCQEHQISQK